MTLLVALLVGQPSAAQAADRYNFDLPAQTLSASLDAYTRITGIAVRVNGADVQRIRARPLRGDLTPAAALTELLSAVGLTHSFSGDKLVIISAAGPAAEPGARVLAPVRVQGSEAAAGAGGANGSTDPTATEGTRSLTSKLLTIGSKAPLAMKDTVQSVSVITRQRIEDQRLDTLADVMAQTPGITNTQTGGSGGDNISPVFYSRGFVISNFQIDGGAPLTTSDRDNYASPFRPIFDTSIYDHVEVQRGAAGLFNGVGDPGGVISLERKRPIDRTQVVIDAELGSFNKRRVSVDGSVPLTDDGRFAVRGVLTRDTNEFFYDTADSKTTLGYINAQAKLLPGTTVNVGGSITDTDTLPWYGGLPRKSDGSAIELPREFCLCTPASQYTVRSKEWFLQWNQQLGTDWSMKLNFTNNNQSQRSDLTTFSGPFAGIQPDGSGLIAQGFRDRTQAVQRNLDVSVSGEFDLLGRRHQLSVGASTQRSDSKSPGIGAGSGNYSLNVADPNIYQLDRAAYAPQPGTPIDPGAQQPVSPINNQRQSAFYISSRWQLLEPLHLTLGWRVNRYHTEQQTDYASGLSVRRDYGERSNLPPTVGLSYDLTQSMTVYASRAGIYQSQSRLVTTVGGAPLGPVTGTNLEFGIKRSDFEGTLNSALSVYRIVQKNIASQAPFDPATGSGNVDPATGLNCCYFAGGDQERSKGIDIELSGALTPRWQIATSYTFNLKDFTPGAENPFSPAGYNVTFVPKNLFKLWTTYRLAGNEMLERTQLGLGVRVQDATRVVGAIYDAEFKSTPYTFAQGGYALVDLMARHRIAKGVELQFNVNNLFDRNYYATVGSLQSGNWYGAPRNFSLALRWSL